MGKKENIAHIVLVDIRSDGSIPDYQDVGWFQGIEDGYIVINKSGLVVTRYKVETVKKLRYMGCRCQYTLSEVSDST